MTMDALLERLRAFMPKTEGMVPSNKLHGLIGGIIAVPLLLLGLWKWFITASPLEILMLIVPTAAVELGIWSVVHFVSTMFGDRIDVVDRFFAQVQSWEGVLVTGILSLVSTKSFLASSGILPILFHPSRARWYHFVNALTFLMGLVGVRNCFTSFGLRNQMNGVHDECQEAARHRGSVLSQSNTAGDTIGDLLDGFITETSSDEEREGVVYDVEYSEEPRDLAEDAIELFPTATGEGALAVKCAETEVIKRKPAAKNHLPSDHVLDETDPLIVKDYIKKIYKRGLLGGCIVVDSISGQSLVVEFHGPGLREDRHIEFTATSTFEEATALRRMARDYKYHVLILQQRCYRALCELLYANARVRTNPVSGKRMFRGAIHEQ